MVVNLPKNIKNDPLVFFTSSIADIKVRGLSNMRPEL